MLSELIRSGFGNEQDYNCAEKILYGANQVYGLGLSPESLKLAAGFGGGAAIGELCGALCGAVMVLSHLHVQTVAHQSEALKPSTQELLEEFKVEMGVLDCNTLKEKYRTPEQKCLSIIDQAAMCLDRKIAALRNL
ncbi:MAG TPA: hypothetical protein DIT32_01270 [Peptococcaceae bacterium]|nr:hypothetical protein [Peptococcaceae bacterium]